MFFPDIIPAREQCFSEVAAALVAKRGRVYLDASVLIHCYEMSGAARDELLTALGNLGEERVLVPTWAAKETWDFASSRIAKRPLASVAGKAKRDLERFRKEALRYIDDDALPELSSDEYQGQLTSAVGAVAALIDKVATHEPKADVTTAALLPFIESRRLPTDLDPIIEAAARAGALRLSHTIPPGFGDAKASGGEDDSGEPILKGKKQNAFGDLIVWLEILADCKKHDPDHIVFITKDTTKQDWTYVPEKVLDEKGRPQNNHGLVTLPLPLLVHDVQLACRTPVRVHIVSVEFLAHVLQRNLKASVSSLAAAFQAVDERLSPQASDEPPSVESADVVVDAGAPTFSSADMAYEFKEGNEVDDLIQELSADAWRVQNQATRRLTPNLSRATRNQRVQIGRGLVSAVRDGAIGPIAFLRRLLESTPTSASVRADILIGVLAEVYVSDDGEPKKPDVPVPLAELIFDFDTVANLEPAYQAVLERLQPVRRQYLALPRDRPQTIQLDISLEGSILKSISASGVPLTEEDAPPNRAIYPGGRQIATTLDELVTRVSREYAVPRQLLITELPSSVSVVAPENIGFAKWGPGSGVDLR